jgi:menaquinone-dependent protoporphyrinogen IX oxidase
VAIETNPKVLIVYYTFTQQSGLVAEVMAKSFTANGCEVTKARIEFTDPKWSKRFSRVPMSWPALRISTILIPQRRRKTGEIAIPPEAQSDDYDLVVIGGPTWWLTTNMPIRSYLESPAAETVLDGKSFAGFSVSRRYWKGNMGDVRKLGEASGGRWLGETHFVAAGNQVNSMLSWLAYMRRGEPRERLVGVRMPPPNLKPDFEEQTKSFVDGLVKNVAREPVEEADVSNR